MPILLQVLPLWLDAGDFYVILSCFLMLLMRIDYHIHTPLCNHATSTPMQITERALELDISEIGFAEHSPWMIQGKSKMAPSFEELEWYFGDIKELQKRYNGKSPLTIRLGMEMDYHPSTLSYVEQYSRMPFIDFVIGSIHYMGFWTYDIFDQARLFNTLGVRKAYEEYFARIIDLVRTGLFDVVGHIDIIKLEGVRPEGGYRDLKEKVADVLADSGMVVEFNTSGYDRPVGEPFPDVEFLRILKERNVPVTLSSDCHTAEQMGRYFDRALDILRSVGYTELITFDKRRKIPAAL